MQWTAHSPYCNAVALDDVVLTLHRGKLGSALTRVMEMTNISLLVGTDSERYMKGSKVLETCL